MALTVAPVSNPTLVNAPVNQPKISGVITATPGSNGFAGLPQGINASGTALDTPNTAPAPTQSGAPAFQDKSNDIAIQNAGLGSVGQQEQTGIGSVDDAFNRIMGLYNTDDTNAASSYGKESDANQNDLQGNKQTALQNAVQGRQGLFGTLASLGALNGDGIDVANRAVAAGANTDLTNAADNFATNQNGLDSGYSAFKAQDEQRKASADQARTNDEQRVHNDAAKSRQAYDTALANDYTAEGNTGQATNFTNQAASLAPTIAGSDVPAIDIGYSGSAFTAPTLQSYVGKANNTTVQSTPAAGGLNNPLSVPGLIAAGKKQGA